MDNGARIDEIAEADQSTAVHVACTLGSFELVKLMSEKQADLFLEVIHAQDIKGWRKQSKFPHKSFKEIVCFLIVFICVRTNKKGMTPLHRAAMLNHCEIVKFLLAKGAYIESLDNEKRTPMLLAATYNCVEMLRLLLEMEASVNAKDAQMRNFLHLLVNQDEETSTTSTTSFDVLNEQAIENKTPLNTCLKQIMNFLIKVSYQKIATNYF